MPKKIVDPRDAKIDSKTKPDLDSPVRKPTPGLFDGSDSVEFDEKGRRSGEGPTRVSQDPAVGNRDDVESAANKMGREPRVTAGSEPDRPSDPTIPQGAGEKGLGKPDSSYD